jgi:hypothetical protein
MLNFQNVDVKSNVLLSKPFPSPFITASERIDNVRSKLDGGGDKTTYRESKAD